MGYLKEKRGEYVIGLFKRSEEGREEFAGRYWGSVLGRGGV